MPMCGIGELAMCSNPPRKRHVGGRKVVLSGLSRSTVLVRAPIAHLTDLVVCFIITNNYIVCCSGTRSTATVGSGRYF